MSQDRATFRQLAELRLTEARLLLANGFPSGAYYLDAYAIECALKARIASEFRANEIPNKSRVNSIYTHNLRDLLGLAGLKEESEADMEADTDLRESWTTAAKWSEQARYNICASDTAAAMLDAVEADGKGLMQWLRIRW